MNPRFDLMGYPLDWVDLPQVLRILADWAYSNTPHTVVTLNPEIVVQAEQNPRLAEVLRQADLITADGVGITWAVKELSGKEYPGRAPGVDIAMQLMQQEGSNLRVYFLGSKPGVAEKAAQHAAQDYGIQIAGFRDGYFRPEQEAEVVAAIAASKAHLLLTALGADKQETFNERYRHELSVAVAIGVGGSLDVLSGHVELAPAWTRKLGVEWIWRVVGDRKRWNRVPRLMQFVRKVKLYKRKKSL